jgi:hypothetical protein
VSSSGAGDDAILAFRSTKRLGLPGGRAVALARELIYARPPAPWAIVNAAALVVYISSERAPAVYQSIFRAERATRDEPFGDPEIVAELASSLRDLPSWVSADDCVLSFARANEAGDWNIYIARRP